jgi:hypothetical protein
LNVHASQQQKAIMDLPFVESGPMTARKKQTKEAMLLVAASMDNQPCLISATSSIFPFQETRKQSPMYPKHHLTVWPTLSISMRETENQDQ